MTSVPYQVLIVDDDAATRSKLAGYLETAGHCVREADNGDAMRAALTAEAVDLILLDINLPGEDGLELTRWLRARSSVAIILLTGRTDDVDRIVGLEIGADDYVTKPFNPRELLARVKSVLRRTATRAPSAAVARFEGWTFERERRRLTAPDSRRVPLTRAEFELLDAFVRHPGTVLTRERLLARISHRSWDPGDRTIDVLVRRLRGKLENDPRHPQIILTAHGEGYVFAADLREG